MLCNYNFDRHRVDLLPSPEQSQQTFPAIPSITLAELVIRRGDEVRLLAENYYFHTIIFNALAANIMLTTP